MAIADPRAVQVILWCKEFIYGDRHDESNPYRWDYVELNLLGSPGYDAQRPTASKRRADGTLAADLFVYMDDKRPVGPSEEECWLAARRAASRCNYLGIQDAAPKRKPPSKSPGPWAGTITRTGNGVEASVPQNYGLSSAQVLAILEETERQWNDPETDDRRRAILEDLAVYMLVSFLAGLRGEEVPLLSLEGMLKHWEEAATARLPHLIVALLGRFKGEEGERWHVLPISDVTESNFPTRRWMERGIDRREQRGRRTGWYFQRPNGRRAKLSDYDDQFLTALARRRSSTCAASSLLVACGP